MASKVALRFTRIDDGINIVSRYRNCSLRGNSGQYLSPLRSSNEDNLPVSVEQEDPRPSKPTPGSGFARQSTARVPDSETSTSTTATGERQGVSRETILSTSVTTSGILGAVGLLIYATSPFFAPVVRQGNVELFDLYHASSFIGKVRMEDVIATIVTIAGVTGARFLLLQVWPGFRDATETANRQILTPLKDNPIDVAVVGAVPALAEETLFRWALVPAIYPDWRGVVISGLVFGALHVNGGRNVAFAVWASVVGFSYGQLYLYTGSLALAAAAHACSNVISGLLWLSLNKDSLE